MLTNSSTCNYAITISVGIVTVFFITCSTTEFIKPNPQTNKRLQKKTSIEVRKTNVAPESDTIDFADAFVDSLFDDNEKKSVGIPIKDIISDTAYVSHKNVRIVISSNKKKEAVYSAGNLSVKPIEDNTNMTIRGRLLIEKRQKNVTISTHSNTYRVTLPCTLKADDDYTFLDIDNASYRGSLIIVPGKSGTFTLVNSLYIEDYLKGVVPLEIGNWSERELEAIKAQAIAARTYTYKRMSERKNGSYDLLNTIYDQVYGGATVENRIADEAINATKDMILLHNDSIIYAYYHSTCGGKTATSSEVWKTKYEPYLTSVHDVDVNGDAYCRDSPYFRWKESWKKKTFSLIVLSSLHKMVPGKKFPGHIIDLSIEHRFPCGRVKTLLIKGKGWSYNSGGDNTRFILKRKRVNGPILRSANFTISNSDKTNICLSGKGYGHGVGMCQAGALGRARAGESYQDILKAYYTGVVIGIVSEKK